MRRLTFPARGLWAVDRPPGAVYAFENVCRTAPLILTVLALGALALGAPSCSCGGSSTPCERTTCAAAGANCGQIEDGCGGKLDCGFCGGGLTCGGGGTPNVCGGAASCTPASCTSLSAQCGTVPDGCGGTLHCGYCSGGETCGGGGIAYACGVGDCLPTTCDATGAECGRIPDGCGSFLDCGSCPPGDTCGAAGQNLCGNGTCTPTQQCQQGDCGFVSDGCGDTIDCGGCGASEICYRGSTCVPASGQNGQSVGSACGSDSQCAGGVCLTQARDGWPGGYCTTWCSSNSDCGAGSICGHRSAGGRGICVKACTTDSQCGRPGYGCVGGSCNPVGAGTGGVGSPCTTVADCSGGSTAVCMPGGSGGTSGMCTVACSAGAACPAGTHCALSSGDGVCLAGCQSSTDCNAGQTCADWDGDGTSECVPAGGAGDPCQTNADCSSGTCLTQAGSGWAGGYCTKTCTSDTDCSAGSRCVASSSGPSMCLRTCSSSGDCRGAGYACVNPDGGTTSVCDAYGGGTGGIGDPCQSTADCAGGTSAQCATGTSGFPGGYCTVSCESGGKCPTASTCLPLGANGPSVCQKNCSADSDCRTGYGCQDAGSGVKTCSPGGQSGGTSSTGSTCTQDTQCKRYTCRDEASTGWRGGYCTGPCTQDSDCDSGAHCAEKRQVPNSNQMSGYCLESCTSDSDCRTGYHCWDEDGDGVTECAPWGSGTGEVGDPCTTIDQCPGGGAAECNLVTSGFPMGYCTESCSSGTCPTDSHCSKANFGDYRQCLDSVCCNQYVTCTVDTQLNRDSCPQGQHCDTSINLPNGGHYCVFDNERCTGTSACPDGHLCASDGSCLVCTGTSQCRNDYDCADRDNDGRRECWPAAKGSGGPGSPCTRLRDCSGGVHGMCYFENKGDFPGGYCVWDCSDGTACPSGSTCIDLAGPVPGGGSTVFSKLCLKTCSSTSQCRSGYSCMRPNPNQASVCFQ